jgi:hypothetical protein
VGISLAEGTAKARIITCKISHPSSKSSWFFGRVLSGVVVVDLLPYCTFFRLLRLLVPPYHSTDI